VQTASLALHGAILRSANTFASKKWLENLRHVEGAWTARAGTFHDVEVDHGGGNVRMAEQILDCPDVDAAFEKVGGERMAQGVAGGGFGEPGLAGGFLELALHGSFVDVVSGDPAGPWVRTKCGRWK